MYKNIMYTNYVDCFYYTKGSKFIKLERKFGSAIIYINYIDFETPDKAETYFDMNCGE